MREMGFSSNGVFSRNCVCGHNHLFSPHDVLHGGAAGKNYVRNREMGVFCR